MISRKGALEKDFTDELGSLIQWALQERVVGSAPSSQVWEHIQERARKRVEREAVLKRAGRSFASFLRTVGVWLSVDAHLLLVARPVQRRHEAAIWGYDLTWTRALGQPPVAMRFA